MGTHPRNEACADGTEANVPNGLFLASHLQVKTSTKDTTKLNEHRKLYPSLKPNESAALACLESEPGAFNLTRVWTRPPTRSQMGVAEAIAGRGDKWVESFRFPTQQP